MNDLTVLLLAGGDSDRFWPLEDKHSLVFCGKPLAYHHLFQLRKFELREIVIVANNQNEALFKRLKYEFSDLNIKIILQTDLRGMAGAIVSAKEFIQGKKLLVRNGSDIYEDLLISSIIASIKKNPDGIIAGIRQKTYFPGGYLSVEDNKVVSIVEKPSPDEKPSDIVTIVFDYFKSSDVLLSAISKVKSTNDDIFEKALDLLIDDKLNFQFLAYKGYWGYLKFPWHTLNVMSYFLGRMKSFRRKNVSIHKSAVVSGDVFISDGVKVLENTKIIGPSYIGSGTIIGQNSLVRESMIGANCVVGYSSEIARSYIGETCWFHSNYIGDSVISSNVSMGAGTVVANLKLKENAINSVVNGNKTDTGKVKLGSMIGSGVRIGVNASIMPGIKIGKNSVVGPSVMLDKDLPDTKSCLLAKANYVIVPNAVTIPKESRSSTLEHLKIS